MIHCSDVPMKGNTMTNQSQPGQRTKCRVRSLVSSRADMHAVRNGKVARLNVSVISRNRVVTVNQHALRTIAGQHRLRQMMNGSRQPISDLHCQELDSA